MTTGENDRTSTNVVPRTKQRLGGVFLASVGAFATVWLWYLALSKGEFRPRAALIMPAFFVLGVALVIFPGYREERAARGEDLSTLNGLALITPRWRIILAVALAAGAVNVAVIITL